MIINESCGGAGLNLKIVGNPKPTNPKGNTIWVNTDTAINGYAFSATQPTNPVEGIVWIKTGTPSPTAINVDKKNTVMLYPISCKQYVSGSWVDKTAKTYLNGQWQGWGMFLYNYGETDLSFTFTTNSFSENSCLASNHIYLVATYKSQANVTAAAEPAIDLTPYSIAKIEMSATLTEGSGTTYVGFGNTKGSYSSASYSCSSLSQQVIEIDISSLSGEYFFTAHRDAGKGETKIFSVHLQ